MEKFIVSDMACESACIGDRYSTDTVNISKNVKRNIESRKGGEINRDTMGIPVISIGMSTVMNCATMM